MSRILRLHQQYPALLVEQAIEQALTFGCTHLDGVKHCLEHAEASPAEQPLLDLSDKPHLAILGSQAIDLACYDQLSEPGERHGSLEARATVASLSTVGS
jgi:hypothetical protein